MGFNNIRIPGSSYSSVMGIEILSIAFLLLKSQIISIFLLYAGLVIYLFLSFIFIFKIFKFIKTRSMIVKDEILGYFTFSAGSAVLGTRIIMNNLYVFAYALFFLTIISIIVFLIMYFNGFKKILVYIYTLTIYINFKFFSTVFTDIIQGGHCRFILYFNDNIFIFDWKCSIYNSNYKCI
jgi:tellurite resistance protein TehA-like permease